MENGTSSHDFKDTVSDKTNEFVNKYYKETYVDKFLDLEIVKSTFKNDLFISLNSWFERNIKIITQIIGWISVISGIFLILSPLQLILLLLSFLNPAYFIYILITVASGLIIAVITFITGIGLIKMKKWVPFITIVGFLISSGLNILSNFFNFLFPYYGYHMYYSRGIFGIIIGLAISITIYFIYTCLVVKNKEKFNN